MSVVSCACGVYLAPPPPLLYPGKKMRCRLSVTSFKKLFNFIESENYLLFVLGSLLKR